MSTVSGTVQRVTSKAVGARGSLAYSLNVDGDWYGHGFEKPSCNDGDSVTFDFQQKGAYKNIVPGSLKVVANQAPQAQAPAGKGGYSNTQLAIQYQASRNSALQLIELALQHDALPLPTKKGDRLSAIAAAVDAWTAEYHLATDKVVADGGVFPSELESALVSDEATF